MTSVDPLHQSGPWALALPRDDAAVALALRLHSTVEVCSVGAVVWLRGRSGDEALQRQLLSLPATARYAWVPETGALRPVGSRLASERLPAEGWTPLRAWAVVQWPSATLPAQVPPRVSLRLVRTSRPRPANAWLGRLNDLAEWAGRAPQVRLERLRCATCADGRTLVLGVPTPSLPGRTCVEESGIVIPAGMECCPHMTSGALRRTFGMAEGAVLLWDEAGARLLPEELFVPATRSAVRTTLRCFEQGATP